MPIKVRTVEPLSGYRLALEFSDGTSGTVDFSQHVKREPFRALADERVFLDARVEHGAVEWPKGEVGIATEAVYALAHSLPRPRTLREARANELKMSLVELRKFAGLTQADVAIESGLTQGALSHFENSEDHKLSALRRYVAAMGGQVEVVAVIGSKRITLHGV